MHNSAVRGHLLPVPPPLRTLIDLVARPAEPDAVLLRRFASAGDPAAFAELVRRYGRLVWGQCKNLLHSDADADDAFQATFLTLAKSAPAVRDGNKLGPWLHGVAYRVCQNSRRRAARRVKREKATAKGEAGKPVADSAWDAAFAAVHHELATLPETLRVPFVLCVLEGKGTSEAAAQLGLKLGTFSARLSRAKQALFDKLSARGLTAGLAAVGAVAVGAANVPAAVVGKAADLASGGAVSPNILSLSHGVLGMAAINAKRWVMAAVAAGGLAVGLGGAWQANAQTPAKPDDPQTALENFRRAKAEEAKLNADVEKAKADEAKKRYTEALKLAGEALQKPKADEAKELEELLRREKERNLLNDRLLREKTAEGKQGPEFKYVKVGAEYAPTTEEFEKAVKDGEAGGYTFVGVTSLAATTEKKLKGSVQALVFRKAKAETVSGVLLETLKAKPKLVEVEIGLEEKKLKAEIERLTRELVELKAKEKKVEPAFEQGEVLEVDANDGSIVFTGGAKAGNRYIVSRGVAPYYIGTVTVIDASDPKVSSGVFTPAAGQKLTGNYVPKKGDKVSRQ